MDSSSIDIKFTVESRDLESIIKSSSIVFWSFFENNDVDGFIPIRNSETIKYLGKEKMLCVKKIGNSFLYVSQKNFIKMVDEYFHHDIYCASCCIGLREEFMSNREIDSDRFWRFFEFVKSQSKCKNFIPL